MNAGADLVVEKRGAAGTITLNRPRALNALTLSMTRGLAAALDEFENDSAVRRVVLQGAGDRAFCAGGDIRALYKWGLAGRHDEQVQFWREEYTLDWRIATFPKPVIAIVDGIVMGGGVGLFLHASHRVVTEHAVFAMPEVGIGFFPDVGATHALARLPRRIGAYLAVTGLEAGSGDMRALGLASHFIPRAAIAEFVDALAAPDSGDALEAGAHRPFGPGPLMDRGAEIEAAFQADSRPELLDALSATDAPWAAAARQALEDKSPTSEAIALTQIATARTLTLAETFRQDFRIVSRMARSPEFMEGVRAAVIDKDRQPRWGPFEESTLEGWFAPLGAAELVLKSRDS